MPTDGPDAATTEALPAAALRDFARRVFEAVGLPPSDAAQTAALMLEADLVGADAHGIFRLPQYVRRIEGGGVNRTPRITMTRTAAATALVDGDNGMGHLVMSRAPTPPSPWPARPAPDGSASSAPTTPAPPRSTPPCPSPTA